MVKNVLGMTFCTWILSREICPCDEMVCSRYWLVSLGMFCMSLSIASANTSMQQSLSCHGINKPLALPLLLYCRRHTLLLSLSSRSTTLLFPISIALTGWPASMELQCQWFVHGIMDPVQLNDGFPTGGTCHYHHCPVWA